MRQQAVLAFSKQSDWLEAWSTLVDYPNYVFRCHWIDNDRNDELSMKQFQEVASNLTSLVLIRHSSKQSWLEGVQSDTRKLKAGDLLAAPFVLYCYPWLLLPGTTTYERKSLGHLPKRLESIGVTTVQLSEGIPDAFGPFGYVLGFRRPSIKSIAALFFMPIYCRRNRPLLCYYPLAPQVRNPFVDKTLPAKKPPIHPDKATLLARLSDGLTRPLIVGGFGYDPIKIAQELGHRKYWATSKGKELNIDGRIITLPFRVSAEDILISQHASEIIAYETTAILWAKKLDVNFKVTCFTATKLGKIYGWNYNALARNVLRKIDVNVYPENRRMLTS